MSNILNAHLERLKHLNAVEHTRRAILGVYDGRAAILVEAFGMILSELADAETQESTAEEAFNLAAAACFAASEAHTTAIENRKG
jgi:hypothetical protein